MSQKFILFLAFLTIAQLPLAQNKPNNTATKPTEKVKTNGVELWNCSNINTPRTECLPAFYQNGIVFMSAPNAGQLDKKTGQAPFEFYYSESDRNFIPMSAVPYSLEANTAYHDGGVTYTRKGDLMFFSSNNQAYGMSIADNKGTVNMKIYEAKRGVRDWENIKALPFNSNKFTCFHPTLSADGRYLYFSSNMPGGQGGYDIYVVERKGNTWTKPTNLGAKINTKGDEAFPFIHESGVLFFSSKNGQPAFHGGKDWDIFRIDLSKTGSSVKNLGEPFNSPADDLSLILNTDGDVGYFASRRENGFGEDDIYMFKTTERLTNETTILNAFLTVKDEENQSRIAGAAVRIFEKTINGFLNGDQYYNVEMPQNGKDFNLKLSRKQADQLGKPDRYTTANGEAQYEMKNDREYLIVVSQEGYISKEMVFNTFEKPNATIPIEITLRKLVKSRIFGYALSNKDTRIPNANVKILNLATQKIDNLRANSNGEFEYNVEQNTQYEITAEAQGYENSTIQKVNVGDEVKPIDVKLNLKAIENEVVSKPISTGTVIVLEKIYYDFDKAIIRQGAAQELDALSSLMTQYPSMEVELVSHTDSRGKAEYNQKLSEARAISAKNYLVARGILANRVTAKGAGESRLRNNCKDGVNCTEENHQYNRRTEVTITKINETAIKVQYGDKGPEVINGKNE
jgi:outer membrane protein OmpA-like peptidoglycan-associated protein